LKALFEHSTISCLAREIDRARESGMIVKESIESAVASRRRHRERLLAELDRLSPERLDELLKSVLAAGGNE
jgi:hypothetical protein